MQLHYKIVIMFIGSLWLINLLYAMPMEPALPPSQGVEVLATPQEQNVLASSITPVMSSVVDNAMMTTSGIDSAMQQKTGDQGVTGNINQIITQIVSTKKLLKGQINELDNKLSEVRASIAIIRKNSTDILSKTQEADAQALLNISNAELSKITTNQKFINDVFLPAFDGNITKIKALLTEGQAAFNTRQENEQASIVSQAQAPIISAPIQQDMIQEAIKQSPQLSEKRSVEKGNTVSSFVGAVIQKIADFFIGLKNIIMPDKKQVSVQDKKKMVNIENNQKTSTKNMVVLQLKEADEAIKQLDEQQKTIDKKLLSLEQNTTTFINALQAIPQRTCISTISQELSREAISQDPKWKQLAMFIVSGLLDATASIVKGIKYVFNTIYDLFFSRIISRFVTSVQEKIKVDGKKESLQHQELKTKIVTQEKVSNFTSSLPVAVPDSANIQPLLPELAPAMSSLVTTTTTGPDMMQQPTPDNRALPQVSAQQPVQQAGDMPGMPMV
jgi:hypothetical protein